MNLSSLNKNISHILYIFDNIVHHIHTKDFNSIFINFQFTECKHLISVLTTYFSLALQSFMSYRKISWCFAKSRQFSRMLGLCLSRFDLSKLNASHGPRKLKVCEWMVLFVDCVFAHTECAINVCRTMLAEFLTLRYIYPIMVPFGAWRLFAWLFMSSYGVYVYSRICSTINWIKSSNTAHSCHSALTFNSVKCFSAMKVRWNCIFIEHRRKLFE